MKTIPFQNYPLQLNDFQSPDLIEKSITQQNTYGSYQMQSWTLRGIRVRYITNQWNDYYTFVKENNENLVSLSFNLKGSFTIEQNGNTYLTAPNQHNIIFTNGVGNTFQNKNLSSSSFAIDFIPDAFSNIISISNPLLQAFAKLMQGNEPLVLSPNSIAIDQHLPTGQAGLTKVETRDFYIPIIQKAGRKLCSPLEYLDIKEPE